MLTYDPDGPLYALYACLDNTFQTYKRVNVQRIVQALCVYKEKSLDFLQRVKDNTEL